MKKHILMILAMLLILVVPTFAQSGDVEADETFVGSTLSFVPGVATTVNSDEFEGGASYTFFTDELRIAVADSILLDVALTISTEDTAEVAMEKALPIASQNLEVPLSIDDATFGEIDGRESAQIAYELDDAPALFLILRLNDGNWTALDITASFPEIEEIDLDYINDLAASIVTTDAEAFESMEPEIYVGNGVQFLPPEGSSEVSIQTVPSNDGIDITAYEFNFDNVFFVIFSPAFVSEFLDISAEDDFEAAQEKFIGLASSDIESFSDDNVDVVTVDARSVVKLDISNDDLNDIAYLYPLSNNNWVVVNVQSSINEIDTFLVEVFLRTIDVPSDDISDEDMSDEDTSDEDMSDDDMESDESDLVTDTDVIFTVPDGGELFTQEGPPVSYRIEMADYDFFIAPATLLEAIVGVTTDDTLESAIEKLLPLLNSSTETEYSLEDWTLFEDSEQVYATVEYVSIADSFFILVQLSDGTWLGIDSMLTTGDAIDTDAILEFALSVESSE